MDTGKMWEELAQWGRWLSDRLAGMTWKSFCALGILGVVVAGSVTKLAPAAFVFCALVKAEASARRKAQREGAASEAQAMAWSARLDSHFLFNAMATVEHLMSADPPAAMRVQKALSTYLRSGLSEPARSTVAAQAKACEAYLAIQSERMGERLAWSASWPGEAAPMPGRVVVGLLETAVGKGIEPTVAGGRVELLAAKGEDGRWSWTMLCPAEGLGRDDLEKWRAPWMAEAPKAGWSLEREEGRWRVGLGWFPA